MHKGHVISGAGHLTLIGWVLLGGVFSSEPPPFEATEVSVITGADFDAMVRAAQPPDSETEVAQPAAPEVVPDPPEIAPVPDEVVAQSVPDPVETPPEDTPPQVIEQTPPPPTEVVDVPPELDQPVGDVAVLVPNLAPTSVPRPVARVAPQAVAQPDPEAAPDEVEQAAVAPDETGETPEEPQEATAPEEATTEIVTEATAAPKASPRPPGRPARPEPQVTQATTESTSESTPNTAEDSTAADIAEQVAAGQSQSETQDDPAPSGPPLTRGEKESLRVAVARCWNVGALSTEALQTVIVMSLRMNKDGTPILDTMKLESFTGGSSSAAQRVFQASRSAIVRCGSKGFDLPAEKYSQWRTIEMTFDPRKMGLK